MGIVWGVGLFIVLAVAVDPLWLLAAVGAIIVQVLLDLSTIRSCRTGAGGSWPEIRATLLGSTMLSWPARKILARTPGF